MAPRPNMPTEPADTPETLRWFREGDQSWKVPAQRVSVSSRVQQLARNVPPEPDAFREEVVKRLLTTNTGYEGPIQNAPDGVYGKKLFLRMDTPGSEVLFLVDQIVASVDPAYQTRDVGAAIDLRPFIQTELDRAAGAGVAVPILDAMLENYEKQVTDVLASSGLPENVQIDRTYKTTTADLTPQALVTAVMNVTDPETGGLVDPSVLAGEDGLIDFGSLDPNAQSQLWNEADLQQLIRTSGAGWEALVKLESQDGAPPIMIDFDRDSIQEQRSAAGQGADGGTRKMSATAAMDYLYTLDDQEVEVLQNRMIEAGYFDQLGGEFAQGPQRLGDFTDEATIAAWRLMLADGYGRDKTSMDRLTERTKTYRANKAREAKASTPVMDFKTAAVTSNYHSQQLLGRDLSAFEQAAVIGYIKRLQGQRATMLDSDPSATQQPAVDSTLGYAEQDVREAVMDMTNSQTNEAMRTDAVSSNYLRAIL